MKIWPIVILFILSVTVGYGQTTWDAPTQKLLDTSIKVGTDASASSTSFAKRKSEKSIALTELSILFNQLTISLSAPK